MIKLNKIKIMTPRLYESGCFVILGYLFEEMCKQYLQKINREGLWQIRFSKLGRWWGNDSKNKKEAEIDIVVINNVEKSAIFCECKFRNSKVELNVLEELKLKATLLPQFDKKYYSVFSRSGFS